MSFQTIGSKRNSTISSNAFIPKLFTLPFRLRLSCRIFGAQPNRYSPDRSEEKNRHRLRHRFSRRRRRLGRRRRRLTGGVESASSSRCRRLCRCPRRCRRRRHWRRRCRCRRHRRRRRRGSRRRWSRRRRRCRASVSASSVASCYRWRRCSWRRRRRCRRWRLSVGGVGVGVLSFSSRNQNKSGTAPSASQATENDYWNRRYLTIATSSSTISALVSTITRSSCGSRRSLFIIIVAAKIKFWSARRN